MTCSSRGHRAFSKASPVLWNALPRSIRTADSLDTFKSTPKAYLFTRAFNCPCSHHLTQFFYLCLFVLVSVSVMYCLVLELVSFSFSRIPAVYSSMNNDSVEMALCEKKITITTTTIIIIIIKPVEDFHHFEGLF